MVNFQAHSSARSYKKNISEYDIMKRNNAHRPRSLM